ncbi:hypothetical protein ABTJ37_22670, partial [Acinetobacter baumannii]
WPAIAAAFDGGSAADISQAERFRIADGLTDRAQVEAYLDVFLTENKGVIGPRKTLMTKPLAKLQSVFAARLDAEQTRIVALDE